MNDEVDILPNIVISDGMELETFFCIPVERLPIDTANEAHIFTVIICLSLLISQLCKCINNDTEDDICYNWGIRGLISTDPSLAAAAVAQQQQQKRHL